MTYFAGLSLGQTNDRAALAVCESQTIDGEPSCLIRGLRRWEVGASYPAICGDIAALLKEKELIRAPLILDITMAGLPIGKLFDKGIKTNPVHFVTITGGDSEARDESEARAWRVPKRILVSTIQMLLQTERLKVAKEMAETAALISELSNFKLNKSEATADAMALLWRESAREDLVFAVAVASWAALSNNFRPPAMPRASKPHWALVEFKRTYRV